MDFHFHGPNWRISSSQAPREISMLSQLSVCYQAGPGAYQYQTKLPQLWWGPISNIFIMFLGPSRKILSDNGTEFNNKLFEMVAKELGVEHKIYSPPYRPQSSGRIEGFHAFLKTCLAKHVSGNVEWDEVCTLATAAYNFLPNEHSKESPFFIMFGRDLRLPLAELLQHKLRYLGTEDTVLSLQAIHNMYLIIAENLRKARERNKDTYSKKTYFYPAKSTR